jgi:hypothetical protein
MLGFLQYGDRIRSFLQWAAAAMLVVIGLRLAFGGRGLAWLDAIGAPVWRRLSPLLRHALPIRSLPRAWLAGMLWGWLPCGMAYAMLMVAWLSADALAGASLMAAFGLGTLPALLAASAAAQRMGRALAYPHVRAAAGLAIAALGIVALLAPWWLPPHAMQGGVWDTLRQACVAAFPAMR